MAYPQFTLDRMWKVEGSLPPTSPDCAVVRVYLVRHGETQENREGVIQGQQDTALNAAGLEQAQMVKEALKNIPFAMAYSSDLQRASKTAATILEDHPGIVLVKEEALRERFMGALEGTTGRGVEATGAETVQTFTKRAIDWWNERILGTALGKGEPVDVLVTSHGGWITSLVRGLVGSRKARVARGVSLGRCGNASVTVLEVFANRRALLIRYGDLTHVRGQALESNADIRST